MSFVPRVITNDGPISEQPDFENIPAMLRRYAIEIEGGKFGDVTRCVLITEIDEGLNIAACGDESSSYELMGIFESAKLRVFADDMVGDD